MPYVYEHALDWKLGKWNEILLRFCDCLASFLSSSKWERNNLVTIILLIPSLPLSSFKSWLDCMICPCDKCKIKAVFHLVKWIQLCPLHIIMCSDEEDWPWLDAGCPPKSLCQSTPLLDRGEKMQGKTHRLRYGQGEITHHHEQNSLDLEKLI